MPPGRWHRAQAEYAGIQVVVPKYSHGIFTAFCRRTPTSVLPSVYTLEACLSLFLLYSQLFKAPEFVHKHLVNKHPDKYKLVLDQVKRCAIRLSYTFKNLG